MIIYHITTEATWAAQQAALHFEAPTQTAEGFMHLATEQQVAGVLSRYFADATNLLKLYVDEDLLESPLKYELATNNELFPHLYGPLNKSAIVKVEKL